MSEWRDIASAPTDCDALFRVVPKTAEEAYLDTSGNSIFSTARPRLFMGRYKCWSSLEKATHWMPLPSVTLEAESSPLRRYQMTVRHVHHAMSGHGGEAVVVPLEDPNGEWVRWQPVAPDRRQGDR